MRPLILISNDDGYHAKGINSLINFLRPIGDIIVCAPEASRSGYSRAFSTVPIFLKHRRHENALPPCPLHGEGENCKDGLYEEKHISPLLWEGQGGGAWSLDVWSLSGTPVDCLKMAYAKLCPRKADIVISGINHGDNASTNSHYSGTVGVVMEGALKGIPSIAFSLCDYDDDADFEPMRELVVTMVQKVLKDGLPTYTCLNVNVPKGFMLKEGETLDSRIRYCRMARGHWRNEIEERLHPTVPKPYYWMTGYYQNDEPDAEDTDAWAISHGYIAVTPLTADQTDFSFLKKITCD